jgi:hypothetical protein
MCSGFRGRLYGCGDRRRRYLPTPLQPKRMFLFFLPRFKKASNLSVRFVDSSFRSFLFQTLVKEIKEADTLVKLLTKSIYIER